MIFTNILDELDTEWSIKEKARYLYVELAKHITYDDRFTFLSDTEELKKIYYRDVSIDRDENPVMVCRPANRLYLQLLQKAGIKSELIFKEPAVKRKIYVEDTACIFYDENELPIYTNITGDLTNCKYGLRTQFFGINNSSYEGSYLHTVISKDELEDIDRKIKYIKYDYSDMVFRLIVNEVKNTNNFKRFLRLEGFDINSMTEDDILKNKIQYMSKLIQFRDKTAGTFERKQFYKKLFSGSVLDKFESKKFKAYEFYREKENSVDYISCIEVLLHDKNIYFIYSNEDETYVQIDDQELKEKINGYSEIHNKKISFDLKKYEQFSKGER